jgi:hypothetical protein
MTLIIRLGAALTLIAAALPMALAVQQSQQNKGCRSDQFWCVISHLFFHRDFAYNFSLFSKGGTTGAAAFLVLILRPLPSRLLANLALTTVVGTGILIRDAAFPINLLRPLPLATINGIGIMTTNAASRLLRNHPVRPAKRNAPYLSAPPVFKHAPLRACLVVTTNVSTLLSN